MDSSSQNCFRLDVTSSSDIIDNIVVVLLPVCFSMALKALGMSLDTEDYVFFFELSNRILNNDDPETKRSLLSLTSKVFDPMGLSTLFIIRAKILFLELWSGGLQWDDKLPDDILDQWRASQDTWH